MPDLTQNLELQKPLENEVADIAVINQNMDVIDKKFGVGEGHTHNGQAGQGPRIDYNDLKSKPTLAAVATSGSYNDLSDKPTITPAGIGAIPNSAGSVTDSHIGNRTIDQTQAPTGATGTIIQLFSWFANRIKAITGKANWWDNPAKSLGDLAVHLEDGIVHLTSAERAAWNAKQAALGYTPVNKAGDAMTGPLQMKFKTAFIELGDDTTAGASTPFIDFHYGALNQDYNARIINDADGVLDFTFGSGAGEARVSGNKVWHAGNDSSLIDKAFSNLLAYSDDHLIKKNVPDATIPSNTTLTGHVNIYNNLTVNAGVTLTCEGVLLVKGTLTLNGVISATGLGNPGGGAGGWGQGGAGGGWLIIFANSIVGTGRIESNGGAALAPTIGSTSGSSANPPTNPLFGGLTSNFADILTYPIAYMINTTNLGGGGGGSGSSQSNSYGVGGTGGSGYGSGGAGAGSSGTSYTESNRGGSGGGAGGFIIIRSKTALPAMTIQANGSNGTGVFGSRASGGAGGGGGLIILISPNNSSVITSVAGGTGGPGGTTSGVTGITGSAGLVKSYTL